MPGGLGRMSYLVADILGGIADAVAHGFRALADRGAEAGPGVAQGFGAALEAVANRRGAGFDVLPDAGLGLVRPGGGSSQGQYRDSELSVHDWDPLTVHTGPHTGPFPRP